MRKILNLVFDTIDFLKQCGVCESNSDILKKIKQGAFYIDGEKCFSVSFELKNRITDFKFGKKYFRFIFNPKYYNFLEIYYTENNDFIDGTMQLVKLEIKDGKIIKKVDYAKQ